MYIIFSALR